MIMPGTVHGTKGSPRQGEAGQKPRMLGFADREEARGFLRTMMLDPGNMNAMRQALLEDGAPPNFPQLRDHEVVDLLAGRVASGRFRIAAAYRARAGVGQSERTDEGAQPDEPPVATAPVIPDSSHWMTIEMVDDDDKPAANLRYKVVFPNGTIREGNLNQQGVASFRNLTSSGDCIVSFPDLDDGGWERN